MVHINDDNKSFSIELISGSQSGDSYLFNITKTVWGTQTSMSSQTEMARRLKCDDDGNVYCGRHSNKIWINWPTGKLINSYNPR